MNKKEAKNKKTKQPFCQLPRKLAMVYFITFKKSTCLLLLPGLLWSYINEVKVGLMN